MLTLNKFDDINHLPLRVFNRVVFLNNLFEDGGPEAAKKYVELFDDMEQKQMFVMGNYIKREGVAKVRKEVTRNLVLADEAYQYEQ